MSLMKTQGVVLKHINLNDNDKIITLLTDKAGKIDVVVHGAKSHKSKFLSSTQPFCYGEYMLFRGKSMYSLSQSNINDSFQGLLMNLDKLMYGSYFLELVDSLVEAETRDVPMLALLLKTLYIMTETEPDLPVLKTVFEYKVISLAGYMPQSKSCIRCRGEVTEGYFSIENGGIVCTNCGKTNRYDYSLTKTMVRFFKTLWSIKLEDVRNTDFSHPEFEQVSTIVQRYVLHHANRTFKSLEIINKMK